MTETISIGTPDVYEPYAEPGRYRIDTVEELQDSLSMPFLNRVAAHEAKTETEIFGIDPGQDPEGFLDNHNALLDAVQGELNERLPAVKEMVITRTAAYFHGEDEAGRSAMEADLRQRLAATEQVIVEDSLILNDEHHTFDPSTRQIGIASAGIIAELARADDEQTFFKEFEDVFLAHEVMHGMDMAGKAETGTDGSLPVRNGLAVHVETTDPETGEVALHTQGDWLDEAVKENFRQTIIPTDTQRYEQGQAVVEMFEAVSPGFRDRAVMAALYSKRPAEMFAEVENLAGPTAVEDIGAILAQARHSATAWESGKAKIANSLPETMRPQAKAALEAADQRLMAGDPEYQQVLAEEVESLKQLLGKEAVDLYLQGEDIF